MTILGARPQFIKAAPLNRAFHKAGIQELILHTGQHYDLEMSQVFFEQLRLPAPDINLEIGSGSHAQQTGRMLEGIETVLQRHQPDWVLVYGDTNSTLAGALAAAKLHLPLAHVEAGLRSFNRQMPEEINRILTDHCANLLFCPTPTALANLAREGISTGPQLQVAKHNQQQAHLVGDVMYDAALLFAPLAAEQCNLLQELGLRHKAYYLATLHRPSNTDDPARLQSLIQALSDLDLPTIFPVHPRTQARLADLGLESRKPAGKLYPLPALGYLELLALTRSARCVITDSGGLQKEAFFFEVPCVTLRSETEWIETVEAGWNRLVDTTTAASLMEAIHSPWPVTPPPDLFGDGHAAERMTEILKNAL